MANQNLVSPFGILLGAGEARRDEGTANNLQTADSPVAIMISKDGPYCAAGDRRTATMTMLWRVTCLGFICGVGLVDSAFVLPTAESRRTQLSSSSLLRSSAAAAAPTSPPPGGGDRGRRSNTPPASRDATTASRHSSSDPQAWNVAASPTLNRKDELLQLLQKVPSNRPTPASQTHDILAVIQDLEASCPTPDDQIPSKLSGTWELLWTAQDTQFAESKLGHWINPIENQAYSNNPTGRLNPFMPRNMQDRLETAGWISAAPEDSSASTSSQPVSIRSTQSIDVAKGKVRNVVSFGVSPRITPLSPPRRQRRIEWWIGENPEHKRQKLYQQQQQNRVLRASMTVSIDFTLDSWDPRRINVKFDSSRLSIPSLNMDWYFPLGIFGPTGWLRTVYLDDTLRITRGHKGSVFVLQRPGATTNHK